MSEADLVHHTEQSQPVISVIIATLNCADCLAEALESVRAQVDASFECVVVDGGSTDNTLGIIRQNESWLGAWVSEPDKGIADAFNKGVRLARGEILFFLGADDVLADFHVFADVINMLPKLERPFFFYGDLYYRYQGKKKLVRKNYSWGTFRKYNCLPHQAMFLERSFFDRFGLFDIHYHYAMDYEHISRFIKEFAPGYIPRIVAEMRREGQSTDILATHAEMDKVRLRYGFASPAQILFDRLVLRLKIIVSKVTRSGW